jgi:ATP-dependent Lhr-like helicase
MAISKGERLIQEWYLLKKWEQFPFQKEMMDSYINGFSGLLNAPTGSGKTFAMFLPFIVEYINENPENYQQKLNSGLMLLWITPLRALTNDIQKAMQTVVDDLSHQKKTTRSFINHARKFALDVGAKRIS